jgi:transcriptional regulator with XRE-family HTH domain
MSQAEVAAQLGTSVASVRRYEHGDLEPPLQYIKMLAELSGVDGCWILYGEDAPTLRLLKSLQDQLALLLT